MEDELELITDASRVLALNNALTQVNKIVVNKVRPLKWRTFMTPSPTANPAVQFIESRKKISFADIRPIGPQDQVFPMGTEESSNTFLTLHEFGNALQVNDDELERASLIGDDSPLVVRQTANFRIAEELMDRVTGIGYSDLGMYGMLNQPDVTPIDSTAWFDAACTAQAMLDNMNAVVDAVNVNSGYTMVANRLLMPTEALRLVSRKIFQSNSPDTVLQVFQRQNPGVTVDEWTYCTTTGTQGRMMAYASGDRDVVDMYLARAALASKPMQKFYGYEIAYKWKFSGVYSLFPKGIAYSDGCLDTTIAD